MSRFDRVGCLIVALLDHESSACSYFHVDVQCGMAFTPSTLWNRWDYRTTKAGNKLEGAAPVLLYNGPGWLGFIDIAIVASAGSSFWLLLFDTAVAPVVGDAADASYGPSTQPAANPAGGTISREYSERSGTFIVNGNEVVPAVSNQEVPDSPFQGLSFDFKIYAVLSSTPCLYTATAANLYRILARGTKL